MSAALVSASLTGIGGNPNSYQWTHCFGLRLIKYQCDIQSTINQIVYQGHLRTCLEDLYPENSGVLRELSKTKIEKYL